MYSPPKSVRLLPAGCRAAATIAIWWLGLSLVHSQDLSDLEQTVFKAAIARISPSIVQLETFGGQEAGPNSTSGTLSTGLIVGAEGWILSSQYALLQKPESIVVIYADGSRSAARIVARDQSRMLVLLKANPPATGPLVVPEVVPTDKIRTGQWAIAVGRVFDASKVNASVGIVSARDRVWGKAIQTDAKVSPNNYGGALIDAEGRVLGILAPLSPHSQELIAGAEWYDGGIGFAVPLADVLPHFETLRQGTDLQPGLLGISFKGEDPYAGPVRIAGCGPKSPAFKAGVRPGDQITAVDGQRVEIVAHLRHALGRRYAGETVRFEVLRDEKPLAFQIPLAEVIEPYERPFLGVLPERRSKPDEPGVAIRFVYPGSGAARAGLQPGDRVVKADGVALGAAAELRTLIAQKEPGSSVRLEIAQAGAPRAVDIALTSLPEGLPGELPPLSELAKPPAQRPAVGVVDIRVPEVNNECFAFVPENYDHAYPFGLVVWLHAPDRYQREALLDLWRPICQRDRLILLAPAASNPARWQPGDGEFIRKVVDQIVANYRIDRSRVVTHGYQAGGAMAYFVALTNRELFTGVVPVDAPLPQRLRLPDHEPIYPLSVLSFSSEKSPALKAHESGMNVLRKAKYPVVVEQTAGEPRELQTQELDRLRNWLDALDRI